MGKSENYFLETIAIVDTKKESIRDIVDTNRKASEIF